MSETPLKLFPRRTTLIKVVDWSTIENHEEFMKLVTKYGKLPHRVIALPRANVRKLRLVFRGSNNCQ